MYTHPALSAIRLRTRRLRTRRLRGARGLLVVLVAAAAAIACTAQTPPSPNPNPSASAAQQRIPLDRVVAVVNDELILQSDLDDEERFQAFEPFRAEGVVTRKQILDRLIDRTLILQQMQLQPQTPVADKDLDAEVAEIRKTVPACAAYHCETDAGWKKFCADHGFTPEQVRDRWRSRMQVLQFIEQRFQMGIRITPSEIDTYYTTKLLPAYQKQNVKPPAESAISNRIQQILLQQQVTGLLDDWLKVLRASGSVQILIPEDNTTAPVPAQP